MRPCMTIQARGKGDKMHVFSLFLWTMQGKSVQKGLQCTYLCGDPGCAHQTGYPQCQTLYSCCNNPAVSPWAICKETIHFLILSVLTLISIYRDSRIDVNQARLVGRKDLQNELFKYVCTLTYNLLKDSCDLVGEGHEILIFWQYFQHNGLRVPSIASDAVLVQPCWVILNKFTSLRS